MSTSVLRKRIIRLIVTLLAVSFLSFLLTSLLPGDPATTILGAENISKEAVDCDHIGHVNAGCYVRWLGDAVTGDLGQSYTLSRPVSDLIGARLPITLELVAVSLTIALLVSIPLGIYTAYKPNSPLAKFSSLITYAILSIPSFVIGILLILFFAIKNDFLPAAGWVPLSESVPQNLRRIILPAITLALPQIAVLSRLLRGDMMATLDQDFVSFADSKGLSTRRILLGHAFRPSSFSLLTMAGTSVGYLMGGTLIVETQFNLPGMGTLALGAINSRDLVTVQGVTVFVATVFVVINFLVDVLYAVLDPRIRRNHGAAA
ncbi:MAG TPA: ABC transporter permease [Ilumatobacteraceae bacterium]|nr:ABC transporter permease [Ilumatobacteraceae bacterium]